MLADGQADAIDGDGGPVRGVVRDQWSLHGAARQLRPVLDGDDAPELFDDPGEHQLGPSLARWARAPGRALGGTPPEPAADGGRAATATENGDGRRRPGPSGPSTAARLLPSGLSPSVLEFHQVNRPLAAVGSRTVTAGSDFHRPRSTRAAWVSIAPSVGVRIPGELAQPLDGARGVVRAVDGGPRDEDIGAGVGRPLDRL